MKKQIVTLGDIHSQKSPLSEELQKNIKESKTITLEGDVFELSLKKLPVGKSNKKLSESK